MLLATPYHKAHWSPGIGDPTVMGWLIAGAYLAAALCCFVVYCRRARLVEAGLVRRFGLFWLLLSLVLVLLAVNKQLDLQSLIHITGRNLALDQGWFDQRREVQQVFVAGVAIAGVLSVAAVLLLARGLWRRLALALMGVAVLALFVVVRAAAFNNVEKLLAADAVGVTGGQVLELSGIALIVGGAAVHVLRAKNKHDLPSPPSG